MAKTVYPIHQHYVETRQALATRELARELAQCYREHNRDYVRVDMSAVEFMSRSFADEIHKAKIDLANEGIVVELYNQKPEVAAVLRAVAHTQQVHLRPVAQLQPVHYTRLQAVALFAGV